MRNKIIIFLNLFLIFFLNSFLYGNINNRIVLKVENEIITDYDIKNKILSTIILNEMEINQKNIDILKKQSVDQLIADKLRKIELSKYQINNDPQQINQYLQSISSNNINALKDKFEIYNLDFDLFLEEIKTQLKWQKLIYKIYSKRIEINESIINSEIKKFLKENSSIEEYRLSEIEIYKNDNKIDEKNIKNVLQQIDKKGFENTAKELRISPTATNDGDLGWVNVKSLSSKIYNLIKKLEIGGVTKPITNSNTILFYKLKNKRISKAENINIQDLKKKIISNKKNEMFNLYSNSHLSKIKNNSFIQYK